MTTKLFKHTMLIFFLFSAPFLLTACSNASTSAQKSNEDFQNFLDACFQEYVSADTITLHFKLSDPSAYGIEENESSYGDYSVQAQQEYCERASELLDEIQTFEYDSLSAENQITWTIFTTYLENVVASEDYILYSSLLGTNGLQSQIPVTLSEYTFSDENDIKTYLSLINQIPDLFDQILALEDERRQAGIISPNFIIENTIDQITQFLANEENENLLISSFETKIEELSDLGDDQKTTYINNNRALVHQVVLPSYTSLQSSLQEYLNQGAETDTECLCQYDQGKEYYKLLLSATVGTSMSPEGCIYVLEKQLETAVTELTSLTKENPDLYDDYLTCQPALTDAQEILTTLEDAIQTDFPTLSNVSYTIKEVPDGLSSTSASAFYLVPPIDSTSDNVIYINTYRVNKQDIFSTLAHEGYPGHLYQTNYYMSTNPEPIRTLLRCDGYDEGWGTYAQIYSYDYLEFENTDEETTELLRTLYQDNDIISLSLSSLSDLYVNYKNYTRDDLTEYLSTYGVTQDNADALYEYVIENPTTYLSYSIGYYELNHLRTSMENELGEQFDIYEYHQAVLDAGSCSFDLLEEQVTSDMTRE